jgi:hypothetical protein
MVRISLPYAGDSIRLATLPQPLYAAHAWLDRTQGGPMSTLPLRAGAMLTTLTDPAKAVAPVP